MSLSVVQNALGYSGSGASSYTTGNFSSTTGNLLVFAIRNGGSVTVTSVKNAAGVSFTPLTAVTSSPLIAQFFYLKNITGNATDNITVQFSGTGAASAGWFWEISGADTSSPSDVDTGGTNAGSSPITSNSFTTLNANEILLAWATENATGTCSFAAQSGYNLDSTAGVPTIGSASGFIGAQHLIVSSIQTTVTSQMTFTGVSPTICIIAVASFIAASGGGGSTVNWVSRERKFINKR